VIARKQPSSNEMRAAGYECADTNGPAERGRAAARPPIDAT
jgi:hypothetical protein